MRWFIEVRLRLWLFIIIRIIFFTIWCIQRYIWGPVYEHSVCTAMFHTRGADDPDRGEKKNIQILCAPLEGTEFFIVSYGLPKCTGHAGKWGG